MGNKMGSRRRQVVDEKYTKPQGLYPIKDVDYKKLRKLIIDSKLAPCYPGDDDDSSSLEECPICFLRYPTLNRSRCCTKSICTECFLQMKDPHSCRPTQCPFCKASNYAVEYRGGKSKEERGLEQIEEQKVIEAKIRMRQQELLEEEERTLKRQETSSYSGITQTENFECTTSRVVEGSEASVSSQDTSSTPLHVQHQHPRQNRDDDLNLDLEDIMLMEAIWLSIQESGGEPIDHASFSRNVPEPYTSPPRPAPPQYSVPPLLASSSSPSPSGGLAYSIASLAEQQQQSCEPSSSSSSSSSNSYRYISSPHDSVPGSSSSSYRGKASLYRRKKSKAFARSDLEYLRKRMATQSNHQNGGGDWAGGVNMSEIVEAAADSSCYGWSSSSSNYNHHHHHPASIGGHHMSTAEQGGFSSSNNNSRFSGESDSDEFETPQPQQSVRPLMQQLQQQQQYYVGGGGGSCAGEGSGYYQGNMGCPIIPETFEEQMMLAMAVSLAEARAVTASHGVAWH